MPFDPSVVLRAALLKPWTYVQGFNPSPHTILGFPLAYPEQAMLYATTPAFLSASIFSWL